MSLTDVAEKSGLTRNAIYRYHQGIKPRKSTLITIAHTLGISVETLLQSDNINPKTKQINLIDNQQVDLADNQIKFTYFGKPISKSAMKVVQAVLNAMTDDNQPKK